MKKSILFICETGISAALFVSKMLETLHQHELDFDVDYAPVSRVEEKLAAKDYTVILLSPQVHRYDDTLKEIILKDGKEVNLVDITEEEFASMNVNRILARI
ncbi:PTS cellobiose transporter subunit IIC [Vagococcus penaei]|uniref:PTS cellobiose transporter subunit IIC n=1 Tax=Vagococcus penaei TaxID=633807 RepID=A0A1Q2D7B4_9ENTE|nr:PTS cellobiose transporter subunit IIC [Vagococcus penaei]AQP54264.1 PTS cellobiose transporter subunit IIC [Vagococcus penaei]RSU05849.1 PTS cellobiose transporter subunit IIC [Vagococcus penaei]